ncbi:hypothetical protein D3C81_2190950 [compost metagenome]
MDVVVPIDLTVQDTMLASNGIYTKVKSDEMLDSFVACYSELLDKQVEVAEKITRKP